MGINPLGLIHLSASMRWNKVIKPRKEKMRKSLSFNIKALHQLRKKSVKRKFPYIDIFYHRQPAVVRVIHDLTSGLFEHL